MMVLCQLCGKVFKNKHGFAIHLTRVHNISGPRGRLSLKSVYNFFPLLDKNKWTKAIEFLKQATDEDPEDIWRRGYIHALEGMVTAIRYKQSSPQPYITLLKDFNKKQLQEVLDQFIKESEKPLITEFDFGYTQAWIDHIRYMLNKMLTDENNGQNS